MANFKEVLGIGSDGRDYILHEYVVNKSTTQFGDDFKNSIPSKEYKLPNGEKLESYSGQLVIMSTGITVKIKK